MKGNHRIRAPFISEMRLRDGWKHPLSSWQHARAAKRAALKKAGISLADPETCACGNKALWKWKDQGFCRACRPKDGRELR